MPNKIDALYAEVSKTYDVGSIQDFQNYLADPKKRQLFFKDVIAPEYDVKSLDEFEQIYGLKKKESVSPSQQKKQPTSSATGAMEQGGAPAPSQRKKYNISKADADLNKRITASQQVLKPSELTPDEAMAMAPMMGKVAETSTVVTPKKDEGYFGGIGRALAVGVTEEEAKQAIIPGPQYELEYKGEKVDTDIVNKVIASTYKILGGIAGTPNFAYDVTKAFMDPVQKATLMSALEPVMGQLKEANVPEKALKAKAKQMESKMQKVEGDVSDRFSRGDYADGFRLLSNELASSAPQMLGVMLSGGGPAGMTLLGLSSAEMRADDLEGQDITDKQKYANALAYGGAEVLFELVGAGSMARVTKNIIKREGPVAGKEIVKKGILDVVDDLTVKYPMLFGSSAEGLSEMATTIAQNAADKYGGIDPERDLMEGTADAFIAGNAMGLGLGGVVKLAQTVLPQDKRDQVAKNQQDILKAKDLIVDPNISEEKRTALQQLVNKKIQENENLQRKAFEKLSFIPEDVRKEYASLRQDAMDLESEIESEVDPVIKEALELELQSRKSQIKKIEEDAIQKQATSKVPVQPEAPVGGEVAQGEPQAEPEVSSKEGQKEIVSGIEITYPTQQQRTEREAVRNSQDYVSAKSVELPVTDTEALAKDLEGEFAMVTGENPDGQPLTEEENQALNERAQEWLVSRGYDPKPIVGKFNQAENSFFVKGMTEADAIEFAKEFNQKSVAHSGGMLYQDGTRNPRTSGDDFSFGRFEPGMDMVSIVNTTEGPKQFSVAYDFKTTLQPEMPAFDQAVNNSAQSLKMVAPDLKVIVAENTEDAQLQIAEALSAVAPFQAADVAEGFTTETRGQTVFVNGKPFAIVLDKSQADSKTVGHEAWEVMLNDAFGDDQAKFKEFRDEIDRQLRLNEFGDIADALTKFSNQRGYEDVKYSEYMAELGGMLVANGFKQGSLDAKQKSLLQKIGDVINKFAQLFTGKKQFLDEATPDDILGFMITISGKVAKGEDVSQFFRAKVTPSKTDNKGNLKDPTVNAKNQLKEKTSDIEKKVKDSVSPGNIVSTRIPAKGDPHSKSDLVINTESIMKEAKENKNAEKFAITIARKVADYPIVNVSPESINTIQDANKVFEKLKDGVKNNLKWLYDQFSDEVRTITKLWYDGANKICNEISKEYGYTLDQVAGVMAVLSPQMDWFRNLSLGRRVIDIYNTKQDYSLDDKMADYMLNAKSEGKMLFNEKLTKKEIGLLVEEMKGKKFKELSLPEKAFFVRAYDEVYNSRDYENISPTGEVNGFVRNADGSRGKVGWGGFGPIMKSISILEDGKIKNISENLGEQHKVRNFFNNISNPNDKNAVTIDTHAVAAALLEPLAGSDEQVALNLGGPKTNSIGSVGTYAIYADAYRELASELGILPRELQSITWEAVRGLYKAKFKQSKKNKQAIKDIWEQFRNKEKNIKEVYESINEKAGGVSKPVWYEYVAEGDGKTYEENSAAVDQAKLSEDYQLEQPGGRTESVEVTSRSQKSVPAVVDEVLTDDGKGNYVFVHYSDEKRDTIKPMSGSKKNFTSREEVAAISSVGGVAMYYTKQGQKEGGVGDVPHTVLVPKDKVYFYGTTERGKVSNDPENFYPEARRRFQEYKNMNNPTRPTEYAFDANNAAAWITKVAAENGYDMVVTNWGPPMSYRAQTVKELTPEAEYTGFKQIPEPKYEVGDEVFLYGQYVTLTDVKPDVLTYETEAGYGKYPLTVMTRDKIIMIQKAKPTVTVRAQKKDTYTNEQYGEMSRKGIIFHGGTKTIEKLDPSKIKGGFRAMYGWGVYFAKTIFKASEYGDMITFLDSKQLNFLNVSEKINSDLLSKIKNIEDKNIYYGMFLNKLKDMVGVNINEARLRMGDFIRWDYDKVWSQMFMDAGYDGFSQSDNEYVVFNIEKADQAILEDPLTVTTKSQKVVVNTIPGYERMMGEVEGILEKTMNRTGSYNQATANAIGYIQKSAVYERADDSQREQIIRDFLKIRGEKIKSAPSVSKILGQIKDVKKITISERAYIKERIKLQNKAAKDAVAFVKQLRVEISGRLKIMAGRGVISAKQASAILARYDKMNILNPDMRDRFVDYMANVFQSAEYADKVKEATKLRKTIRKAAKNPDNQAENSKMAKSFAEIDPSRVENIDDYINNAEQMLKAVSRKTGDIKMRSLINMTDMVSYIDGEIQAQREQVKNEILSKYQDLVDAGVLDSKMTINEINKVVAAIEEKKDESVEKSKEAKKAVKQMMNEVSPILLQIARTGEDPFTGDPIDLTQDEKSAIVKLAKMDLDNLPLAEAVKALEYANNFIANGVTSGIVGMVDLYEGSINTEKLANKGFKSIPIKKYFSPGAGRIWMEQIASLPMVNKLMWGTTSRALEVAEASGVTGVSNGKAKAIKIVEKAVKEYVSRFSKVKDFLSSENVIERGMLAFVSRTVIGDEFQAQDEFNRRKSLIEETIQALKDPENSTDAEIKKGEVVEKVYNKILKNAKNANEVRANVSEINKKAVDWWVNEWSKHYDRMDEVSRNVYNTLLSRDANFTPDRFQLKEVSPAKEEDFDSGFFGNFENVSTEKSGSLKENKRIKNLPQNKNGVKTRIVNLDFDVNNVNALTNAMVDIETAGSVMQMKGFVTSKDFGKLFSNKDDKNVYKKRLISYVNRAKGQGYVDQSELKALNRLVNTVASFGTAKALFSLSQPFKQSIPPLFNTLIQTGRVDIGTLMNGGFSFIDRTGYPIANRGISSQGELKSINRQLVEAEKNLLLRGVDGVAQYSNLMLELTLKYPDIMTARSSWLSFYKKGLKKEGIKTSDINWNTHEVNKKAADYAQMMVDSQQNISDSDMQGEFMASKDPAKAFLRRAIFPLMTFVLNQKTRIWADIRTLSNKGVATTEDRQEAALSLSGALVELAAFSAISYAANSMLWEIGMNVLDMISGEDDEEDKEEEKKKMILRRSTYTAQNFMKDFFLPPIPGADLIASKGVNYVLDETGLADEIPSSWFGIEDERVKFRLYDKANQGYLDMLGTQGIALEKALELADYYNLAIDGKYTDEKYGGKKQLLEGDVDMARINAAVMTGYYGGLLPADVAYIIGQINKKIRKRAETAEEED